MPIHFYLPYLRKVMLPTLAGAGLSLALYAVVRRRRLARLRLCTAAWHEGALTLFIMYLCGLAALIVLPPAGGAHQAVHVNLIPFTVFSYTGWLMRHGNYQALAVNFLGNIGAFLPMGLFPCLLWRRATAGRALAVGFLASLCCELCQLPLGRASDVDDLWLNTLGAFLGFLLYKLLDKLFHGFCARFYVTERRGALWM